MYVKVRRGQKWFQMVPVNRFYSFKLALIRLRVSRLFNINEGAAVLRFILAHPVMIRLFSLRIIC